MTTGKRREPKNFKYRHTKLPPDNAENLEMLFSEMYILIIQRGGGGGGFRIPPSGSPPPLDPRLESSLFSKIAGSTLVHTIYM